MRRVWAFIFFIIFVIFMFFIVLNIFLAILNDAYTVVHTDVVWDELQRRKTMSLREKFEVRNWRLKSCWVVFFVGTNSGRTQLTVCTFLLLLVLAVRRCARPCGASARTSPS